MTPAGVGTGAVPGTLGGVPDPAAVTGPPWPRLVAPCGTYLLEGIGSTLASFAHDYQVLLGSFTPHDPLAR
jgi:hypothetical protein